MESLTSLPQETVDRGARTVGGIIQTVPEIMRSQRGLGHSFMCNIVCALVPEGESKDDCERMNCNREKVGASSSSDYGDYGDYTPAAA